MHQPPPRTPRIPFVGPNTERVGTAAPGCPAEQSSAVLSPNQALQLPISSPKGAADDSPGRKSGVDGNKEKNSSLPKAVAVERSSEATIEKIDVFRAFVKAGQRLAEIHVHYEQQTEYPLTKVEKAGEKLDYHVNKMKLSKDKTSLIYNQFLTLSGIPPETYDYRLGNRSVLEWVIDQYQVATDKYSGITNDPTRADDPQYILRLIGQVITVSLETVKVVKSLANWLVP